MTSATSCDGRAGSPRGRRYTITLLDGPGGDASVPAAVLGDVLAALGEGVRRAAQLHVEGLSAGEGPEAVWLDSFSLLDVAGVGPSSPVIKVEAPTFTEAAPAHFQADQQVPTLVGAGPLDVSLTAVDLFLSVLRAALAGGEDPLMDRPMLDACVRFARSPGPAFGGVLLETATGVPRVEIRAEEAARLERLRDETPRPRAVRVVGVLDAFSSERRALRLRLRDGTTFPGRTAALDPEALPGLLGARVAIEGRAFSRPSGRVSIVDVDYLGPAREHGDELFERVPGPLPAPLLQDERSGVAAIFGTWPGDETDEELLAALERVRRER